LDISYEFKAGVDATAQADVMAKLDGFKVEMIGIIKGMAELKGLIEGNAELGIEPPVVTIKTAVDGLISSVGSGKFTIAVGLLPCTVPAFKEAASVLSSLPGQMTATIEAQLSIFAVLSIS
jgi:hypothetical protein